MDRPRGRGAPVRARSVSMAACPPRLRPSPRASSLRAPGLPDFLGARCAPQAEASDESQRPRHSLRAQVRSHSWVVAPRKNPFAACCSRTDRLTLCLFASFSVPDLPRPFRSPPKAPPARPSIGRSEARRPRAGRRRREIAAPRRSEARTALPIHPPPVLLARGDESPSIIEAPLERNTEGWRWDRGLDPPPTIETGVTFVNGVLARCLYELLRVRMWTRRGRRSAVGLACFRPRSRWAWPWPASPAIPGEMFPLRPSYCQ